MSKPASDPLRDLLHRQAQEASEEALQTGGEIPAARVEALGRLARLVEIQQAAKPPRQRKRWPAALLFGATLLIVSALLFARVGETEIELDLTVSEVSFVSPAQQVLSETFALSSLGVSGLRGLRMPEARSGGEESGVRLSIDATGKRPGSLNLSTVLLAPEDRVWLRHLGSPYRARLSLEGKAADFRADVLGAVRVERLGDARELSFPKPQTVLLQSGPAEVDFDLAFLAPAGSAFAPQLGARNLSLVAVDEIVESERTVVRRISTIESGSLYFVSLGDQERKLRPGEMIQFEESRGEIRVLRLLEDRIELNYHGRVRGLSTGEEASRRNLMPSWLEWLGARHSLSLLWGSAIYLSGLIAAALRWFGRSAP